jgi:uncharacterized surface protein with fasciclin (FAS1) repeats
MFKTFIAGLVFASALGCSSSTPDAASPAAAATTSGSEAQAAGDIIATARGAGTFGTLLAAVDAAGLTATLQGAGPFTVFAPTDAAFAALPAGTVETLLRPENRARLTAVLTYHVVSGNVRAAQVTTMTSATSLQGAPIAIAVENGRVKLNGSATVTTADVAASNGVIHVIDRVILPPG